MTPRKILAIEDQKDIRALIRHTLELHGFDVELAVDGRDAIYKAQSFQPEVIICDIMLPYFNGYQVYTQLEDMGIVPRTPFIFLTALDTDEDVRLGMNIGDDYIVKPFDPKQLVGSIKARLHRRDLLEEVDVHEETFDIFISYSHDDRDTMRRLRDSLIASKLDVWTDERIEDGQNWEFAVAEAIKSSGCVVALLTPSSARSVWVGRELGYAENNGTRIFPVLISGNVRTSVPMRLVNHNFIDGRTDHDSCVSRLAKAVRQHLNIIEEE